MFIHSFLERQAIFLNKELVNTLLQLGAATAVIMLLIVLACLVTPKLARFLEKKYPQLKESPERVEKKQGDNPESDVQGPYDASKIDDFDPNYKIYNEDIYGVDFKHGKKRK